MRAKLVRDHCAAVLEGECLPASTEAEYQMALLLKGHEEIQEIADFPEDPEEYADLLEVIISLADHNGVDGDEILEALEQKWKAKGGFEEGQIFEDDGKFEPPFPPIVIDFDFNLNPLPTPQDYGFAVSREQVGAQVGGAPLWIANALKRGE